MRLGVSLGAGERVGRTRVGVADGVGVSVLAAVAVGDSVNVKVGVRVSVGFGGEVRVGARVFVGRGVAGKLEVGGAKKAMRLSGVLIWVKPTAPIKTAMSANKKGLRSAARCLPRLRCGDTVDDCSTKRAGKKDGRERKFSLYGSGAR